MPDNPLILFFYTLAGVVGLCFGSFATALIYRIPRKIPWIIGPYKTGQVMARSSCPACNAALGVPDLVPVFSWLCLRGKCRHCGHRISPIYPLIELLTMALTILLFHAWGPTPVSIPLMMAVPFLVAATVIDWEYMLFPDNINISLFFLAMMHVVTNWWDSGWAASVLVDSVLAAIVLTGLMACTSFLVSRWKGREALGRGDIKFLPAAGLFLGMAALPSYLALSGALGIATALVRGKNHEKQVVPFGPALIISLYLHVFLTGLGFDYKW